MRCGECDCVLGERLIDSCERAFSALQQRLRDSCCDLAAALDDAYDVGDLVQRQIKRAECSGWVENERAAVWCLSSESTAAIHTAEAEILRSAHVCVYAGQSN